MWTTRRSEKKMSAMESVIQPRVSDSSRAQMNEQRPRVDTERSDAAVLDVEVSMYQKLGWKKGVTMMMKTMFGLGALGIPAAFAVLGLAPGIIALTLVYIMSTWSMWVIGQFKSEHPEVESIQDAARVMFGKPGKIILVVVVNAYYIFTAAAALLTMQSAFSALNDHKTCAAAFVAVAMVVTAVLASIRTLQSISLLTPVGLLCITSAILVVTISVAFEGPAAAPKTGNWTSDWKVFGNDSFSEAMAAVSTLVFSFSGCPYFFSIHSQMRQPEKYNKAMLICQTAVYGGYLTIGTIVYYYCGSFVSSPALDSAGSSRGKIAYGVGLFGIIVTATIVTHVPSREIVVQLLRIKKFENIKERGWRYWMLWIPTVVAVALTAYIVASVIPEFGVLISLIGALFGTPITLQMYACMWLYDNKHRMRGGPSKGFLLHAVFAVFVLLAGFFCQIAGTYGAALQVAKVYKGSKGFQPWSC